MTRWSEKEYTEYKAKQAILAPLPRYHDLAGAGPDLWALSGETQRAGLNEADTTKQIRGVLNAAQVFHWKNWSGPMTSPKGISDILGIHQGRMLAIEIKHEGWKPPGPKSKAYKHFKAQEDFIFQVNQAGGIGFFAQSAEEVVERLDLKGVIMPLWGKK